MGFCSNGLPVGSEKAGEDSRVKDIGPSDIIDKMACVFDRFRSAVLRNDSKEKNRTGVNLDRAKNCQLRWGWGTCMSSDPMYRMSIESLSCR